MGVAGGALLLLLHRLQRIFPVTLLSLFLAFTLGSRVGRPPKLLAELFDPLACVTLLFLFNVCSSLGNTFGFSYRIKTRLSLLRYTVYI